MENQIPLQMMMKITQVDQLPKRRRKGTPKKKGGKQ